MAAIATPVLSIQLYSLREQGPLAAQLDVVKEAGFPAVETIQGLMEDAQGTRALLDERGLTVRNLVLVRRLEWAEVVDVRFGEGRPWVQLDLADGDTLAVMAIQRADGPAAQREARRLATLVARHTATGRDD